MILVVSLQGVNSGTLTTLTFNTPAEVYRLSSVVRPPGAFRASMKCQEPMALSWRVRRCLTPTKAFAPLLAHFP